jgi:hypothetical protein
LPTRGPFRGVRSAAVLPHTTIGDGSPFRGERPVPACSPFRGERSAAVLPHTTIGDGWPFGRERPAAVLADSGQLT